MNARMMFVRAGENVANLLRRGYGGQDVEMLPSPNPISNERS